MHTTKAMVASVYAIHTVRRAAEYGVVVPDGITIDMKAVVARREAIVARSRSGIENSLRGDPQSPSSTQLLS
jgi:pyruvate/2-oxoglutarate dehydrogenase complex dihydrolipoamide dehydrogenase (E3) component